MADENTCGKSLANSSTMSLICLICLTLSPFWVPSPCFQERYRSSTDFAPTNPSTHVIFLNVPWTWGFLTDFIEISTPFLLGMVHADLWVTLLSSHAFSVATFGIWMADPAITLDVLCGIWWVDRPQRLIKLIARDLVAPPRSVLVFEKHVHVTKLISSWASDRSPGSGAFRVCFWVLGWWI